MTVKPSGATKPKATPPLFLKTRISSLQIRKNSNRDLKKLILSIVDYKFLLLPLRPQILGRKCLFKKCFVEITKPCLPIDICSPSRDHTNMACLRDMCIDICSPSRVHTNMVWRDMCIDICSPSRVHTNMVCLRDMCIDICSPSRVHTNMVWRDMRVAKILSSFSWILYIICIYI